MVTTRAQLCLQQFWKTLQMAEVPLGDAYLDPQTPWRPQKRAGNP